MADTDTDLAAQEAQRRSFLLSQPPEPPVSEQTDYTQYPPRQKTQSSPQSTTLSFEPPPQLKQYNAPVPQPPVQGNPFDVFRDPMVVLAGLSSLFTRRPLIGAMNYAAGAMQGYNKGQNQVFEQNKQRFDEAIKATLEQNRIELTRYNAAWDRRKEFNWQKVAPKLYGEAGAAHDTLMQAAIESGNWDLVEKILIGRETAQNHIQNAVDIENARQQAKDAEIDRLKQDPGVIGQAEDVIHFRKPLPPLSRNNPRNQAINELVTERSAAQGEPYQASEYAAKNKFVTGLGSTTVGSSGGQINSAKIVVRHLSTLDRLADDLGTDSNTATFRRAAQAIQTEFGLSSAPTNFDAAVGLVAGEIIKLVEGAGGTGEDRNRVVTAFSRANSTPLLHDAVDVAREVMSARVDSLAEQAKAARAEDTFKRFLPPDIQKLLEPRRKSGAGFDVEVFRKKAKAEGHSDAEIDQFLASKGH